MLLAKEMTRH